jgi:hypothetical protein
MNKHLGDDLDGLINIGWQSHKKQL